MALVIFREKKKKINESHHLGLVPHVLLAVGHGSTQRRRLYILTPVGWSTSTLLSAEQRGRYSCKVEKKKCQISYLSESRHMTKPYSWTCYYCSKRKTRYKRKSSLIQQIKYSVPSFKRHSTYWFEVLPPFHPSIIDILTGHLDCRWSVQSK